MAIPLIRYALDVTGTNIDNLVLNEEHTLNNTQYRAVAPIHGPYFTESLVIFDSLTNTKLTKGVDYQCVALLQEATLKVGKEICELILIINNTVSDTVRINYQVLGGLYQNNAAAIGNLYEAVMKDQRAVDWNNILNKPAAYPPSLHRHLLDDIYGFEPVVVALERIRNAIILSDVPIFEDLLARIQAIENSMATAGDLSKYALIDSPAFTGNPTAPTPALTDNDTSIATTAFVKGQAYAPINSPVFTGTPKSVTPAVADNSTNIATTAFVKNQNYATLLDPAFTGNPTAPTPATTDSDTSIATTAFVKNQGYAPLNSPIFVGTPVAPTPALTDNDTSIATTAFVKGQAYAPINSPVFTGTPKSVTPAVADNSANIATTNFVKAQAYAPLANPTFTGTPKAPTPAVADNDTSIATTAFVKSQGYAPLNSPIFVGNPTAPTPALTDSDTSIATTAFVKGYVNANFYGTGSAPSLNIYAGTANPPANTYGTNGDIYFSI